MTAHSSTLPAATMTEAILESISEGVFTVDNQWRITSFNRAAEQITGVTRAEALQQRCYEVFKSSMCEGNCPLRATLTNNQPIINRAGYFINAAGERVAVSVSTAVLKDAEGRVIGGAETFRDLSEVETLRSALNNPAQAGRMLSHSPAMQPVINLVPDVAASNSTVLIQGETGTGKELLAKTIHELSPRAGAPFVAVNCGALPDNLLESELFGYKKGAFTGATQDKPGRFALAGNGTLFLDEIGEVSPALQVRLLRVLQEQTFEPLGSTKSEQCHARIIAATHRDLTELVAAGSFRQDLFYRIHVVDLTMPPLRERSEDIDLLVNQFIHHFNQQQGRSITGIHSQALAVLRAYRWPGNIRELENVIERAFVLCREGDIELRHLPAGLNQPLSGSPAASSGSGTITDSRRSAERQRIVESLERHQYNRKATADELGIHKTTLYRKMKALAIDPQR
ncbi:sigma-54 interaction domain-containing protein [Reinekea marinisedimentorum]|uniref:PAS domain S-box-containing protein n=1 Tax=Reinekea marinisedimentorum TaxID=230495 RepID=A0A4R3I866_9GAMM|nr:sigma 54-interacting transcriptional regulator [Reinekea marinisedimentorum]TCS40367.1 PAS domain S-box-containing protein [Reinekea marinisedimentorum]